MLQMTVTATYKVFCYQEIFLRWPSLLLGAAVQQMAMQGHPHLHAATMLCELASLSHSPLPPSLVLQVAIERVLYICIGDGAELHAGWHEHACEHLCSGMVSCSAASANNS
jgi:hypothetical protein